MVLTSLSPIISSIRYELFVIQIIKLDIYGLMQSVSTKATMMKRVTKYEICLSSIKKHVKSLSGWVFCH
ncbi:hypothetical protein CJF30_00004491 [Rutstroemia sp. NJR-2017a BBW]|nr:hypothetical protein CJF30_00004491 [Rutstroemia sp. NJR-2017a BBW]